MLFEEEKEEDETAFITGDITNVGVTDIGAIAAIGDNFRGVITGVTRAGEVTVTHCGVTVTGDMRCAVGERRVGERTRVVMVELRCCWSSSDLEVVRCKGKRTMTGF